MEEHSETSKDVLGFKNFIVYCKSTGQIQKLLNFSVLRATPFLHEGELQYLAPSFSKENQKICIFNEWK